MFFIGIDVAKRKHNMAAVTGDGGRVIESFEFSNTQEGFEKMVGKLRASNITHENSRVALEATGHYSRSITEHLVSCGFEVVIGNPLQTHNFAKAQSIRKVKNDAVDSLALAQWLLLAKPDCAVLSLSEAAELKSIARFRTFQSQIIRDSKCKVHAILDQLFPEYASYFSDVFGSASLAVLKRYPSAKTLSRAHLDSLTNLLEKSSRGKLGSELAWSLRSAARQSFATNAAIEAQSLELMQLISLIEFTKSQLAEIDKEMERLLSKADTTITSIPGIGIVCGATILGEIGDISRFKRSSSLVAFAGLDPSVYESGEFKGTKNHLSKRGSTYLRWALWIAADRARRFDPVFGEYYAKKRLEGKCHKVATTAVARKLCNAIFAVLSKNTEYVCPLGQ
ncbi:MAG: IS110 family transposase [Coriobacteriales bacterium]|jgi:transposase|nr:IS110 family transposase [Coriobacteriales bacterium]